jgi:hypothetical protein
LNRKQFILASANNSIFFNKGLNTTRRKNQTLERQKFAFSKEKKEQPNIGISIHLAKLNQGHQLTLGTHHIIEKKLLHEKDSF